MKKILTGSKSSDLLEKDLENNSQNLEEKALGIFDELIGQLFEYESEKVVYELNPPASGFSRHWFINHKTKMMESFSPKVHVELIEELDEDNYLCYAGGCHIVVNKNYLSHKVEY